MSVAKQIIPKMRFSKLLISFVFLGIFIVIESRVFEDRYRETGEYEEENGLVIRESGNLDREKRGVFGFFEL
ncbi:hypothetical protein KUTeg_014071 [Tegillarca granosa]|uniref:Uncharacterized protein n=1 Tax=Tegillarca granosa TaxID=220873 RepID=A0ABQ9EZ14_TEGGR|nr:hypothetical protein KUTeg_014071 [Tegillarca granosa]